MKEERPTIAQLAKLYDQYINEEGQWKKFLDWAVEESPWTADQIEEVAAEEVAFV